ncbi:MAG: hypothetical protein ABI823_14365 [Bryobacteraceae bacterium]
MRLLTISAVCSALLLSSACSRAKVTTEVKANGGWTRTVALTGGEKKEGMESGSALEDTFVVPTGPEWKSKEEKKDSDRTITLDRTLAVGASIKGDVTLRSGDKENPGKTLFSNEATVTRLAPRRFEYKETLRWTGPPSTGFGMKDEDLAQIKQGLPKALATDENARALGQKAAELAVPLLFGPGDPLLALGLLHPDLAARRATQRMGAIMLKALEVQFGDKLPLAERREVARKLIESTFAQARPAKPDPSAGPPADKNSSTKLTSLMFVLKAPGKIVSSNGEVDELTGEVFWALFPEAALLKPLTLTAVVEAP